MSSGLPKRTVFIVSDGTGITAETFSHSILSQFQDKVEFSQIREPFIKNEKKAIELAKKINQTAIKQGIKPIVFSTLVRPEILAHIKNSDAFFIDIFATVVNQLENELQVESNPTIGLSHLGASTQAYRNRIEAINFSLAHDDGQFVHSLHEADVILVGVSRCGKTPTSLYLAMQYSIKVANYPLIPEDFDSGGLPKTIKPYKDKIFGLTIDPVRLAEVRFERRPNSVYCSLHQCIDEVAHAESMMRREGIRFLSTTAKSIEEISTSILQLLGLHDRPGC